ncbi:MAG: TetR family transcriptional regulator [Acidimicrobiales bacterium]
MAGRAPSERRGPGRRPGKADTRGQILEAAVAEFGAKGFDRATIRGVAEAAGVDPALVHHYFGTKDALFIAAMELPFDPRVIVPMLLAPGVDGLGERILRTFLGVWEAPASRERFLGIVRSAFTAPDVADLTREFISHAVLGPVAEAIGRPDARLRASLVGSQLMGLAVVRYILEVEPLASAPIDEVIERVAPTLQRYLTG